MYSVRAWIFGVLSLCVVMLVGCENKKESEAGSTAPAATAEESKAVENSYVKINTNQGSFVVELNAQKAPVTVDNFLTYVKDGFYSQTLFHRVIPGFMIQGGGFTTDFTQKPANPPIKNEADNGLHNVRGSVAMARTMDPNSASAQFFINVSDNNFLDYSSPTPQGWGYAVFGRVVEGMDVVDAISKQKTGSRAGHEDVPVNNVIIESIEVVPAPQGETQG